MTSRNTLMLLFALLATAAAVAFLAISIDREVYAPGAGVLHRELAEHNLNRKLPHLSTRPNHIESRKVLRKLYSIVAFSIVGFFAAPLIPRSRRIVIDALLIAAFSGVIEIAQAVTGADEGYLSNTFDIGCGGVGGAIGAAIWNPLLALVRRRA